MGVPQPLLRYMDTQPFWDGVRERRLVLQICSDTKRFQHPPRPVSIFTGSRRLEWHPVSGRGHVAAFTIVAPSRANPAERQCIVTVTLEESVRIAGKLLGPHAAVKVGAPVHLVWEIMADGEPYPAFELDQPTD